MHEFIAQCKVLLRHKKAEVIFWAAAVVFLFANLGQWSLWGSEDRWAEISRMMLLSGDYFHPVINGEIYFDKPLLSYWLIVAASYLFGGLSEFVIRFPSAAAALLGLYGTVWLGKKLWNREAGIAAGWLLLSCYGFIFWGRTAAADMENLAAVILATAWFYARKDKPGFLTYLVFYLICFLGALTKGLPALILPFIVLFPWYVRDNRWKAHLRFSHLMAAAIGLALYLLPFLFAAETPLPPHCYAPEHRLNGLELVWRENIVRALKPFDHDDEPFFCYFYQLPRLLVPWSALFVVALAAALASLKKIDRNTRLNLEGMALIFLLFSLSGSRRWYYILPIMPFCALLIAVFLQQGWRERWRDWAVRIMTWIIFSAAALSAVSIVLFPFREKIIGARPPDALLFSAPVAGAAVLAIFVLSSIGKAEVIAVYTGIGRAYAAMLIGGALMTGVFFCLQLPSLEQYRTEKAFVFALQEKIRNIPPENIIFYKKAPTKVIYYLALSHPASLAKDAEALKNALRGTSGEKVIIAYNKEKTISETAALLPAENREPVLKEKYLPGEKNDGKKLHAWITGKQVK